MYFCGVDHSSLRSLHGTPLLFSGTIFSVYYLIQIFVLFFTQQCASGWLNKDGCLSLTLEKLTAVNTQTPTSSSLLRPTVSPLSSVMVHNPTNTPSDCSKKVFHMSQDKESTCTNDGIYPDEWNSSRKVPDVAVTEWISRLDPSFANNHYISSFSLRRNVICLQLVPTVVPSDSLTSPARSLMCAIQSRQ